MESTERAKIDFIKLTYQELSSKIALLVSNKSRVIFWKASPSYYEGSAKNYQITPEHKIRIELESNKVPLKLINDKLCLHFTINKRDYFLRGISLGFNEDRDTFEIDLDEECFRGESRGKERLITFPKYQVFAYLKFQRPSPENVFFFNRKEQDLQDFFAKEKLHQKNKMLGITKDLLVGENEELAGFRVEDLSSSGLSFFVSQKEKELIFDKLLNCEFNLVLNFDLQTFTLENAKIIYQMDYIGSQFSGIPMFKIGMSFKNNMILKKRIEEISGINIDLVDYQKEFEEFIRND